MNRSSKSAIKSLVLDLRHTLEDEIAIQLKRYGFAGERWLPLDRLPHIQRDDRATIEHFRLKAALEQHLRRIGAADPEQAKPAQRAEAAEWFVREVAFTHLNRLAALKCLEVRGLIPEIITVREAYGGRSRTHYDYRNAHPEEARGADDALPAAIAHACRTVYAEFRFLFDVGDADTGREPPVNSILWPSHPVLKRCIELINGLDSHRGTENTEDAAVERKEAQRLGGSVASLWAEDEIIGWIYQFYNAEHKVAVRQQGRPRRPAEVAVINQFFTPRWVVKFLVDNTLGRLWLEMHPDSARVRAKCDYLAPEPLASKQTANGRSSTTQPPNHPIIQLDPDSPVNNPRARPRRPAKRPQDIRLIDPACGTMHFGHYAFEVFVEIYRDANEHGWFTVSPSPPAPSPSGRGDRGEGIRGEGLSDADIPAAILRHNLYGVDIDLRAVQLAGLSLYIKAKTENPQAHIAQVNLVVADAVLPADGIRAELLAQYKDNLPVQNAVRQVLDEMANVAEVGSLLRVEERLRGLLSAAGESHRDTEHTEKKSGLAMFDDSHQDALPGLDGPPRQLTLAEAAGANPQQWGAHYTVARLLEDLRQFARRALQTHDLNAQLFAEEAEKTVHLLDVFLNDYDVVVMNPPYGETNQEARSYLQKTWPNTHNDLYAAFFECALELAIPCGYIGALTSSTFLYLSNFEKLRHDVLLPYSSVLATLDLGMGILDDATVNTAATVLAQRPSPDFSREPPLSVFFRLSEYDDLREVKFKRLISESRQGIQSNQVFLVSQASFAALPGSQFAYWVPSAFVSMFQDYLAIEPSYASVRNGIKTGADGVFIRSWWEISPTNIGATKKWVRFANGGSYSKYYDDIEYVVLWDRTADAISSYLNQKGQNNSRIRPENKDVYFCRGITYQYISSRGFNAKVLPENSLFGVAGSAIFPSDTLPLYTILAILNSSAVQFFLKIFVPSRVYQVNYVRKIPFSNSIELLNNKNLDSWSHICYDIKLSWDTGNELCTRFSAPWLLQAQRGELLAAFPELSHRGTESTEKEQGGSQRLGVSVADLLDTLLSVEQAADARLQAVQAQIDQAVYDLYEISPADRALIERELGQRPPELVWPQMERKSQAEKRREHVRRLVSYCLLQALHDKRDGILPLSPIAGQETALDAVRRRLEGWFGEPAAFQVEDEIKGVLGRGVGEWLEGEFWKWHISLYKNRPPVWHLSSPGRHFGCLLHIHKLDGDTLRKVQTLYLWPQRRAVESELASARAAGSPGRIEQAEAVLDDLADFERRLLSVIEGRIQAVNDTARDIPGWAEGPFRSGMYDPVLDDGVLVNIAPLQAAGVLRVKKVV